MSWKVLDERSGLIGTEEQQNVITNKLKGNAVGTLYSEENCWINHKIMCSHFTLILLDIYGGLELVKMTEMSEMLETLFNKF